MVQPPDLPAVVFMMSILAAVLWSLYAGARTVAGWARRRGRRPWLWVVGAYAALNIVVAVAHAVLAGGAR